MLKRTLTTLLLIPPVVYLIGWSPEWLFLLAVVTAVVLALREFFALCRDMGLNAFPWVGYVAGAALCGLQILPGNVGHFVVAPTLVVFLLVIPAVALWRSTDLKGYLTDISVTLFGIMYIGLTLSCLVPIRFFSNKLPAEAWKPFGGPFGPFGRSLVFPGPKMLLFLFVVIWAGDICAYLVGRHFGRTPFFTRISPRKTWEGSLAGLAGSLLAAWAFEKWSWEFHTVKGAMLIAAWIAVAGQVGDLVESAIKRGANQKDSGTLLPGHGGFLDRIDSLLFAAPALWLAMLVLGALS